MSLELRDIRAGYGSQPIVFDVSATFASGKITAIIGPNGAGKSTLIKSLFGQATLFGGSVLLDGQEIPKVHPRAMVKAGVTYVPQLSNIFPGLTVGENLEIGTYVRRGPTRDRVFDLFPDLEPILGRPAGKLSGGQRNMVAVGRALMSDPVVLLLDEATAGLAPALAEQVWKYLAELTRAGLTVGVVEQNVTAALEHSDYVYMLASGRVRMQGAASEVAQDAGLQEAFLGSEGPVAVGTDAAAEGGRHD